MKFFAAVVTLVALASSTALAADLSNCGAATDTFRLTSLSISPDPPKANSKACITITGTLSKEFTTSATIKATGVVGGFEVDKEFNLCSTLQDAGTSCPVPTTTTSLKYCADTSMLPTNVPMNLKVEATDSDNSRIFCFSAQMTIAP